MHVKLFQSGLPHKIQFINPQCACTARVTVVGSVCLSVDRNLTSGASVHLEKDIMYSTGNGQFGGISLSRFVTEIHRFLHCMAIRVVSHFGNMHIILIAHAFSRIYTYARIALRVLHFRVHSFLHVLIMNPCMPGL